MRLNWNKSDIERKCGFQAKKFTDTGVIFTFILAVLITLAIYGFMFVARGFCPSFIMFFHGGAGNRSTIPYYIIFFTSWSLAILFVKSMKLSLQTKALKAKIMPDDPNFILSPMTVSVVLTNMYEQVDTPKHFMLFNRVERALSNLKNIGRVSDVVETLSSQADIDEQFSESTYTLIRGFIWAIPVLGFIGTVLGLSQAVGGFGSVIASGASMEELKQSLGGVTGGLATAFETTLIALVAALFIQILLTMLKKREEDFLEQCSDYCHKNIIAKLKTMGIDDSGEITNYG